MFPCLSCSSEAAWVWRYPLPLCMEFSLWIRLLVQGNFLASRGYPDWLHFPPPPFWAESVCLQEFFPPLKQREWIQWSLFATNRVASTPFDLWHFGPVDNLQKGSVPACFPGGVVFSIFHGFHRYSGATEAGFWKSMGGYRLKWSPACEESLKNF